MYKADKTAFMLQQHPIFRGKDMPLGAVFFSLSGFPSQAIVCRLIISAMQGAEAGG